MSDKNRSRQHAKDVFNAIANGKTVTIEQRRFSRINAGGLLEDGYRLYSNGIEIDDETLYNLLGVELNSGATLTKAISLAFPAAAFSFRGDEVTIKVCDGFRPLDGMRHPFLNSVMREIERVKSSGRIEPNGLMVIFSKSFHAKVMSEVEAFGPSAHIVHGGNFFTTIYGYRYTIDPNAIAGFAVARLEGGMMMWCGHSYHHEERRAD